MNLQYYKLNPSDIYSDIVDGGEEIRKVSIEGLDLLIFPHVYPSERFRTTKFLFESFKGVFAGKRICDMGCGPGIIGLYALQQGAQYVVQVDINPIAVDNAKENNILHGFGPDKVQVYESDCFTTVPKQVFDVVVFNVPFHSEVIEIVDPLQYAFYDPNFRSIKKFLNQLLDYIDPNSEVFIAFSSKGNISMLEALLSQAGFKWNLVKVSNSDVEYDNRLYLLRYCPNNSNLLTHKSEGIISQMYFSEEGKLKDKMMDRLFPSIHGKGCINFGYWEGITEPLTLAKRLDSQKQLYSRVFQLIPENSSRVLEVGCGRGQGIAWLSSLGYNAYGVDCLNSQIEISRANYPDLYKKFHLAFAEQLPFDDVSFDVILSVEAAQHFNSLLDFFKEAYRILIGEGTLIITAFFLKSGAFIENVKKIIPDNHEGLHNTDSISEVLALVEYQGFEIQQLHSLGESVFPKYAIWQKQTLGHQTKSELSPDQMKWESYYTGGGDSDHPWLQAYSNGWIDYYIISAKKK